MIYNAYDWGKYIKYCKSFVHGHVEISIAVVRREKQN